MSTPTKTTTNPTLTIAPKFLKALALFASKDETRYVLCGVQVEKTEKGLLLIATDGKRALIVNTAGEADFDGEKGASFTIPTSLVKQLPAPDSIFGKVKITATPETIQASGQWSVSVPAIEGTFPSWRQVVPTMEPKPLTCLHLNVLLLSDFGRAAGILYGAQEMVIGAADSYSAMTIRTAIAPDNFLGIIMPVRSGRTPQLPSWL